MNKCHIYYDEETDSFLCHLFNDEESEVVSANIVFPELDKVKFKKVKFVGNAFNISNDYLSVTIYDMDKFSNMKLTKKVPNITSKIYQYIFKYQMTRLSNDVKVKVNKQKKKIACAVLVSLMLTATASAGKDHAIPDDEHIIENVDDSNLSDSNIDNISNIVDEDKIDNEITAKDNQITDEESTSNETVNIDYDNLTDSDKFQYAKDGYFNIVNSYANKWGVDPELMMGMLTQESGGKNTNLMQITFGAWSDEVIEVYNFNENRYQRYILSDNPNYKSNSEITVITSKDLKNPKTNISVGCILFRKCLENMNYHIAASICCYNQGFGNMSKIFRETYASTGMDKDEILSDQNNIAFNEFTYASNQGDKNYLTNVLRYMEDPEVNIKVLNEYNEIEDYKIMFDSSKSRN